MTSFAENLAAIEANIKQSCERFGRIRDSVKLLAVSKTVQATDIICAAQTTPQTHFGENRADSLRTKAQALAADSIDIKWHFIGNIQTNKLGQIVPYADLIHSVSSLHAISAIAKLCAEQGKQQKLLLEVNTSGELSKTGANPIDLAQLIEKCNERAQYIRLCGLMTMAPQASSTVSQYEIEQCFAKLQELLAQSAQYLNDSARVHYIELSMGMSGDYELAIAHGATIVRIGTALWK